MSKIQYTVLIVLIVAVGVVPFILKRRKKCGCSDAAAAISGGEDVEVVE